MDDPSLIKAYVANRSEAAFAQIVHRYIDLVYAAAQRQVRDAHLAEDVTQQVFILLARKARAFTGIATLHGWLLKATHFAARDALRAEARRRNREKQAAISMTPPSTTSATAKGVSDMESHLDRALMRLSEAERNAVALRYFEERSFDEIAALTNVSLEAATKRTARAVARLRSYFEDQGITMATGSLEVGLARAGKPNVPGALAGHVASKAFATPSALFSRPMTKMAAGALNASACRWRIWMAMA